MLQYFSKSIFTIAPSAKRSICTKNNPYSASSLSVSLSSKLFQRPRVRPQFFRPSAFKQYASKPVYKSGRSDITPAPAPLQENLPGFDNQPRLLDRLKAAGAISNLEAPPSLSHFQRLFFPLLFTLSICGGSYYFAQNWKPAPLESRLFPTLPQSFTTVATIIAANCVVFLAWKIPLPMSWRLLNRYFISVPALPYSFSIIGNVFSHQTVSHLAMNMFVLYIFGSSLCDQIGRGNFLALYFSAGAVSSFTSLAYNVIRARFHIYALGASGAISGVIGAYTYFNPERELYFVLLPFLSFKAYQFVSGLALIEVLGIIRGWTVVDHVAHLSGMLWGIGYAYWKDQVPKRKRQLSRKKSSWVPW